MITKNKLTISVAIATYNEQNNLNQCLTSVNNFANEIVLVDGSSVDETIEIAKKFGAKIIKTTNKKMFHINKNLAIYNCKSDWIMLLDADERVPRELSEEMIKKINSNPRENGFWINRRNWFLGGFITQGGTYPDSVIRLFKKGKGKLPEKSVHEQIEIDGKVGKLENELLHFADPTFSRYLQRSDRYSTLYARELEKNNPGKGIFTILNYTLFKPFLTFINIYVRHRGFQDGLRGFIWAIFSSSQHYFSYTKYWQKNHSNKNF